MPAARLGDTSTDGTGDTAGHNTTAKGGDEWKRDGRRAELDEREEGNGPETEELHFDVVMKRFRVRKCVFV